MVGRCNFPFKICPFFSRHSVILGGEMRGIPLSHVSLLFAYPIGSMYVIFSYMYLKISQMYVNIPYMDTTRIFLFQNCHLVYELHLCFSKASFYVYLTAHIWFDFQCVTPFYPIICVPSNEARKNAKKHPTFFFVSVCWCQGHGL